MAIRVTNKPTWLTRCDTICRPFRAWEQGSWVDVVELDRRTFGGVLGLRDGQTQCWQRKKMTSGTVSKVPFGRQRHVTIVLTAGTVSYFHICRCHRPETPMELFCNVA